MGPASQVFLARGEVSWFRGFGVGRVGGEVS